MRFYKKKEEILLHYLGGMQDKHNRGNITGSSTLCEIALWNKRCNILIDFGLFQWFSQEEEWNLMLPEDPSSIDYVIITHAHMDHIGRIPFLIKHGFCGKIIMTGITKQLARVMLEDYVSLTRKKMQEIQEKNKKLGTFLRNCIAFKTLYETYVYRASKKEKPFLEKKLQCLWKEILRKKWISEIWNTEDFKKIYQEACQELSSRSIQEVSDIKRVLSPVPMLLYTEEDIYQTLSSIETLEIGKEMGLCKEKVHDDSFEGNIILEFFWSWHIEGGAQVLLTVSKVRKKVQNIIHEKDTRKVRLLFTWDVGRFDTAWNMVWIPQVPPYTIDYVQMESTYGWKEHVPKMHAYQKLLEIITASQGKILIPAFSLQRTQEILMFFLQVLLALYKDCGFCNNDMESYSILENYKHIQSLTSLHRDASLLDIPIFVDSPLSMKITDIFVSSFWTKYSLLLPHIQKHIFKKQKVMFLEEWKYKKLYSPWKKNEKAIILSASWMAQWGSVIPHIIENIQNPHSTIVFVGYVAPGTLWYDILHKKEVIIWGNIFEVHCKVECVDGLSSHADTKDIEHYLSSLSFSKHAHVALTHGNEDARKHLQKNLETIFSKYKWKVDILLPYVWDSFRLKL